MSKAKVMAAKIQRAAAAGGVPERRAEFKYEAGAHEMSVSFRNVSEMTISVVGILVRTYSRRRVAELMGMSPSLVAKVARVALHKETGR